MALRLSKAAEADLLAIYIDGIVNFGIGAAEAYHVRIKRSLSFLEAHPEGARLRTEITPAIRVHPVGAHLILYTADAGDVLVIRIRHSREDWQTPDE
jgi:toxin ParE1/3/4